MSIWQRKQKTKVISASNPEVVKSFCDACNWALGSYFLRKYLFDEHPQVKELQTSYQLPFFFRLSHITQEYWFLQLTKLHDSPVMHGKFNLTVDYMIEYGNWSSETDKKLRMLNRTMKNFLKPLKIARNKLISHNDLNATLAGNTLGAFSEGEDIKYFKCLVEFAQTIHTEVMQSPYAFDELIRNDVDVFMNQFVAGAKVLDS